MKNLFYEGKRDKDTIPYVENEENNSYGLHFHRNIELLYVTSGKVQCVINDNEIIAEEDDIIFINSCYNHSFKNLGGHKKTCLIIPHKYISDFEKIFKNFVIPSHLNDKEFNKSIKQELELFTANYSTSFYVCKGYINIIIGKIISHYKLEPIYHNKKIDVVIKILDYIEKNYNKELSLEILANTFGYSQSHFSKLFKSCVQENLVNYVNYIRLNKFIETVKKEPDANYSSVAINSGFDSLSTFYRVFKKAYDKSPSEYFINIGEEPQNNFFG